jgi:hypothetical protein
VLGFDNRSLCLVESKSLSVLTVNQHRSSQRRASLVKRNVSRAIKKLGGALKRIRSGGQICNADGGPIMITDQQNLPAHAIVLLSEMYAFLDWELIARDVDVASENESHKALFHVIDLMELSYIVNQSKDSQDFYWWLAQRWLNVKTKGKAYCRSIRPE